MPLTLKPLPKTSHVLPKWLILAQCGHTRTCFHWILLANLISNVFMMIIQSGFATFCWFFSLLLFSRDRICGWPNSSLFIFWQVVWLDWYTYPSTMLKAVLKVTIALELFSSRNIVFGPIQVCLLFGKPCGLIGIPRHLLVKV